MTSDNLADDSANNVGSQCAIQMELVDQKSGAVQADYWKPNTFC